MARSFWPLPRVTSRCQVTQPRHVARCCLGLSDLQATGTDRHQEVVTNGFELKPIAAAPLNQTDFGGPDPRQYGLYKVDGSTRAVSLLVNLDDDLPIDEGMEMFHAATPAGLACASCHAEGGDDGHVWTQQPRGRVLSRRTKSLLGGLTATKPFRWDGTHTDLLTLSVEDMKNMGVTHPNIGTLEKMAAWLDKLPAPWFPRRPGEQLSCRQRMARLYFRSSSVGLVTMPCSYR